MGASPSAPGIAAAFTNSARRGRARAPGAPRLRCVPAFRSGGLPTGGSGAADWLGPGASCPGFWGAPSVHGVVLRDGQYFCGTMAPSHAERLSGCHYPLDILPPYRARAAQSSTWRSGWPPRTRCATRPRRNTAGYSADYIPFGLPRVFSRGTPPSRLCPAERVRSG